MTNESSEESEEFKKIPDVADDEAAASTDVTKSTLEAQQFSTGESAEELEKAARKAEHDRNEKFRAHFGNIVTGALYFMAIGVATFAAIWSWHLLAPREWRWLDLNEIQAIQNIVTGGVLAGLIADQFRKRIGKISK
ncbi:MAG: hypothetical protein AAGI14_05905 [Pseudomonadota bacterium]